jgi:hypothetical protein
MTQLTGTDRPNEESSLSDGQAAINESGLAAAPLGLAALLWRGRKQREWCCESCRQAAESQPATW